MEGRLALCLAAVSRRKAGLARVFFVLLHAVMRGLISIMDNFLLIVVPGPRLIRCHSSQCISHPGSRRGLLAPRLQGCIHDTQPRCLLSDVGCLCEGEGRIMMAGAHHVSNHPNSTLSQKWVHDPLARFRRTLAPATLL
jgi:hypothetical protein